jgi:hypothetical protein
MFAIQGSMIERWLMTAFAGDMLLDGFGRSWFTNHARTDKRN